MMKKFLMRKKQSMPPPVQKFRIYAPTHALERRDRLHGSRRGGTYFFSRARKSTKKARFGRAYCRMTRQLKEKLS